MPPSSTITSPSIERPMLIVSGEIEPLAKAKMPPATPQTVPAMAKASQCTLFHVDADRFGAQRRIAAGAHRVAERREQNAPQQQNAGDDEHQREKKEARQPIERRAGQMPRTPFEPPVTSCHWKTIDQTIWAKASVSIAR